MESKEKTSHHKILVRYSSELALKGSKAKNHLANSLRKNILERAKIYDPYIIVNKKFNYLELQTSCLDETMALLQRTFGVGTISHVLAETKGDMDKIAEIGKSIFAKYVTDKTFAIQMKRAGVKNFSSQAFKEKLGAMLLPYAKGVDLKNPEQEVRIDMINGTAYLSLERIKGQGGFPHNSQGTAVALLSGGFDSCVAAWMLMKRGVLCHFVFCNLAGDAYLRLVLQVTKVLVDQWGGGQDFITVNFNLILDDMVKNVKDSYRQVILKRKMLQVAEHFAQKYQADAIVTGESLGQVSSQTLKNLRTIENAAFLPILRPLIGMNKQEIIDQSYKIGTGFLSEHIKERCNITQTFPALAVTLDKVRTQESAMDSKLLEACLASHQIFDLEKLQMNKLRHKVLFKSEIAPNDQIIDCQMEGLYKARHIKGAMHMNLSQIHTQRHLLNPKQTYLIYCTYGTQSAMVAEYLQQMGFEAYAFAGGLHQIKKLYPNLMEA